MKAIPWEDYGESASAAWELFRHACGREWTGCSNARRQYRAIDRPDFSRDNAARGCKLPVEYLLEERTNWGRPRSPLRSAAVPSYPRRPDGTTISRKERSRKKRYPCADPLDGRGPAQGSCNQVFPPR